MQNTHLIQKDFSTIHTKNKSLRIYQGKQQNEKHIKLANQILMFNVECIMFNLKELYPNSLHEKEEKQQFN